MFFGIVCSFYILIHKSDVNKKIIVGFLSFILLVIIFLTSSVKGFSFGNTSLVTDKDTYYTHEKIKINASWELYYDSEYETSYVQIQIIDIFDEQIWNSARYYSIGIIEKNWTVNIQALNITYSNFSNVLIVRIYQTYTHSETGSESESIREITTVNLIKRSITCQLTGFKNDLILGDSNSFSAYFFSTETGTSLMNETFQLITTYNKEIFFQTNFTTNESGEVSFNISTISHLNLGRNEIIFRMKNNVLYNDTAFSYEIFVKKIPVFVNITNFEDNLEEANIIKIQLYYYYLFNQSEKPIENEDIKLVFYINSISEYESNLRTNQSGFLDIKIFPNNIIFKTAAKSIYINVIFNGTGQLENKTISFNLKIENFSYQGISTLFSFTNISLFSILVVLFLFISLKVHKLQRTKFKLIRDLTFKF
ncbi:MAG: hypothetical protein KGD70_00950 [Candidatus Lokiarchaeota archaeon]|nr:hypothetical protein [Candidatus Lokiarchaeota archaeon]